jgi:hypothetical protein
VVVNIGVNREDISKGHVTYFYDEDICFARLGFPHMLAASNAPAGTGSIQAEVYFSNKYKPFTGSPDDWVEPVIRDLRRCGLLRDDDEILCRKAMLLPYANIIFTDTSTKSAFLTVAATAMGAICGLMRASKAENSQQRAIGKLNSVATTA